MASARSRSVAACAALESALTFAPSSCSLPALRRRRQMLESPLARITARNLRPHLGEFGQATPRLDEN